MKLENWSINWQHDSSVNSFVVPSAVRRSRRAHLQDKYGKSANPAWARELSTNGACGTKQRTTVNTMIRYMIKKTIFMLIAGTTIADIMMTSEIENSLAHQCVHNDAETDPVQILS